MIVCGRSCFQEVSETPVATGKSGPQSWHKTTPFGATKRHLVNLGKALQRVLEKVLLRDHQLKLQSPGPKFWWFLLMDGLNVWWDLWWVFDKRYPWILKDLLGWITFLLFWALTKSLDQMSFYHEDLWLFVFLVRVFQTWYFDVIFPNDMSWVRKMIVHHRTVANKRLSACPLFTTCDF